MKFLIDAQLPPALADWIRVKGHDAIHVASLNMTGAADSEIAALAHERGMVVISKDEDFVRLRLPDRFGLLWLRCGNVTNHGLRLWLEPRWMVIVDLLNSGERFVEAR